MGFRYRRKYFFIKSPIIWKGNALLIDNGNKLLLNGKEANIVFFEEKMEKTQ